MAGISVRGVRGMDESGEYEQRNAIADQRDRKADEREALADSRDAVLSDREVAVNAILVDGDYRDDAADQRDSKAIRRDVEANLRAFVGGIDDADAFADRTSAPGWTVELPRLTERHLKATVMCWRIHHGPKMVHRPSRSTCLMYQKARAEGAFSFAERVVVERTLCIDAERPLGRRVRASQAVVFRP
jgi:hypothetical protein